MRTAAVMSLDDYAGLKNELGGLVSHWGCRLNFATTAGEAMS
jgi:hypothetical protein